MAAVISSVGGTRTEPIDNYVFVRGTTAIFKTIFINNDSPTRVDVSTFPIAQVLQPLFLSQGNAVPQVLFTLQGTLTPGQDFEYQFVWDIPSDFIPLDEYIVSYQGVLGGITHVFGDEFFQVDLTAEQIGIKTPSYATVDDVRKKKFNIDDYLPVTIRTDLNARNNLIDSHLQDASAKLREELNLSKQRSNTQNYRLFCTYYAIWSLLLAARGEDGSSVSDQNILFWRTEWERLLAQEKRKSVLQGVPLGRG